MLHLLFWMLFLLPLVFFVWAWLREKRQRVPLALLALSGVMLLSSLVDSTKVWLLGADYSGRLYTTLGVNLVLVLLLAGYLAFKKNWVALVGAGILALEWFFVVSVNSVA